MRIKIIEEAKTELSVVYKEQKLWIDIKENCGHINFFHDYKFSSMKENSDFNFFLLEFAKMYFYKKCEKTEEAKRINNFLSKVLTGINKKNKR